VPGGKPVMYFTIVALLEAGDEAIYPNPGFPIYESMIKFQGAKAVSIPLEESRGFSFDLDLLERSLTKRTKLVILNSPANPTGGIMPRADVQRLADILRDRDIMVLSDEIYSRICYTGEPVSIASFPGMLEKTIILDGFSKTYSMTGWRLGYGVMPEGLGDAVVKLMVNSNSCTASFTQRAGIAALEGPQDDVNTMVAEFRKRRDVVVARFRQELPGVEFVEPLGAFYFFFRVDSFGKISGTEFCTRLVTTTGVALVPGAAFGDDRYVRLSYAASLDNIQKARDRIIGFAKKLAD